MIAMPKSLQTAAGWKLTLTAKKAEPGPAGALGGLAAAAAAATPLGDLLGDAPVTITHTMFRADIAVSKGLGLDGGRVRILVSNMPFRILQQVLTAYEKAQDQATKSGASGPLVGSL